ncbi:MAG: 30S ribosomal protein S6 [Bdellovibrionales bacterium]|nr:30S ribosomal protein S6 [Bdellovibrionales bacterium]
MQIRSYEGVVVLHPDTTEESQKEFFRKNKKIIEDHKGSIHSVETWGKRTIANPIKDIKRGVYFHYTFKTQPDTIAELERTFRINDRVLRFMHTSLGDADLAKHMEAFHDQLSATAQREKEREAKKMKRNS